MEMILDSISHVPSSLVKFAFVSVVVDFVDIILQDCYFRMLYMVVFCLHTFSLFRKIWKFFIHKFLNEKPSGQVEQQKPCICGNLYGDEKLSLEEVKNTMEELLILEETSESSKIGTLFEEEVSLEEVEDAFGLFDENDDGFIDASELRNALFKLSCTSASESECKKMITAFDDDKDGRISFNEFVKLLEYSFS